MRGNENQIISTVGLFHSANYATTQIAYRRLSYSMANKMIIITGIHICRTVSGYVKYFLTIHVLKYMKIRIMGPS